MGAGEEKLLKFTTVEARGSGLAVGEGASMNSAFQYQLPLLV